MRALFFILIAICPFWASSAHLVGGQIEYTCLGSNNYEIKVRIYRDCFSTLGADFDDSVSVAVFNGNLSNPFLIRQIFLQPNGQAIQLSNLTTNPCLQAPPTACTEYLDYTAVVFLPPSPNGYILSHQRCCRNATISNISAPGTWGNTYTIEIPANDFACNSSPVFQNVPPVVLCIGNDINFDHSATDPDGDSLYYSLCSPLNGGSQAVPSPIPSASPPFTPVPFISPYSQASPLPANPSIGIDPSTGILSGVPTLIGQYVFAVCVFEYRNGNLLSTYRRDFQFNVVQCTSNVALQVTAQQDLAVNTTCNGLTIPFSQTNTGATNFLWYFGDPNNPNASSTAPFPTYTYSDTGTYTVSLVINRGTLCADSSWQEYQVNYPLDPEILISGDFCSDNQQLVATATGNYGPDAQFRWQLNGVNYQGNPLNLPILPNNGPFLLSLDVKDFRCSASTQTSFQLYDRPVLNSIVPSGEACLPYTVQFRDSSFAQTPLSHFWDFGDGFTSTDPNPIHTYNTPGLFSVSHTVVADSGCLATLTDVFSNVIRILPSPTAGFSIDKTIANYFRAFFTITDSSSSDVVDWVIDMGDGTQYANNPSFIHTYRDSGNFIVRQIATNDLGCTDTFSIQVRVQPPLKLYIPNAFSPNNDGNNDFFFVRATGFVDFKLQIWSRWGEKTFETTNPRDSWNGQKNNLEGDCPIGVYSYLCEVEFEDGSIESRIGSITLYR